jgi:hypothetical protein
LAFGIWHLAFGIWHLAFDISMRESDKQVENEALKLQNILDEKDQ